MVNKVQILVIALRKHTLPTDIMVPKKTKLNTINRNTLFLAQLYSEIIKNDKFLYSFSFNWNGEGVSKCICYSLSDTGYSFRETYSPYRHYGSKENQTRYNMDRHEGQNRYPNIVHSNGYNTYSNQYTCRVVDQHKGVITSI
jgi:hypothetical protein